MPLTPRGIVSYWFDVVWHQSQSLTAKADQLNQNEVVKLIAKFFKKLNYYSHTSVCGTYTLVLILISLKNAIYIYIAYIFLTFWMRDTGQLESLVLNYT